MAKQTIFSEFSLVELKEAVRECIKEELKNFQSRPSPIEDELFTPKATALKLGISLPTLSKWKKLGLIQHHKVGIRSIRYKASEIQLALKTVKKYGRM